jgi:hypothetical protein
MITIKWQVALSYEVARMKVKAGLAYYNEIYPNIYSKDRICYSRSAKHFQAGSLTSKQRM